MAQNDQRAQALQPEDAPLLNPDDGGGDLSSDVNAVVEQRVQRRFETADVDFASKFFGFFACILGLPLAAALFIVYDISTPDRVLSGCLFMIHFIYFANLYRSVFNQGLIYRIQPRYKSIEQRNMLVLSAVDEFPEIVCESISEFSNIRGAISNQTLTHVGIATFTVYIAVFLFRAEVWTETLQQALAAGFSSGAGLGLTTLGMFEMNPEDKRSQIMHYVGFAFCLGSFVGLGVETSCGVYFWIFFSIAMISTVCWVYFMVSGRRNLPSKDAKYVDKMSKRCIMSEGIVLLCGSLAFDVYLVLLAHR